MITTAEIEKASRDGQQVAVKIIRLLKEECSLHQMTAVEHIKATTALAVAIGWVYGPLRAIGDDDDYQRAIEEFYQNVNRSVLHYMAEFVSSSNPAN